MKLIITLSVIVGCAGLSLVLSAKPPVGATPTPQGSPVQQVDLAEALAAGRLKAVTGLQAADAPERDPFQLEANVGNNAEAATLRRFVPEDGPTIRDWIVMRLQGPRSPE